MAKKLHPSWEHPVALCEECQEPIYKGQAVYTIENHEGLYCTECVKYTRAKEDD